MYYVYLLKSEINNFLYIGSTPNIPNRLLEHNSGRVKSTKYYKPLKLIYYEAFLDKHDALVREQKLKHHGSVIGHLKKRLSSSLST